MDKKTIARLKEENKIRTDELIHNLMMENGLKKAKENKEWLELTSFVLNAEESNQKSRFIWPFTIGMTCLLIIGLMWTQRIQTTDVSFEIISKNVGLILTEEWELRNNIDVKMIEINKLDTVLAPEVPIKFQRDPLGDQEPAFLRLTGPNVKLGVLRIRKETSLDLTLEDSIITF